MLPSDFHMNTLYGHGVDWPLTYTDLKPYYRKAEREIGVAGDVDVQEKLVRRFGRLLADADAPRGVVEECCRYFDDGYVYPMQEVPSSYVDGAFAKGVKDGVDGVDTPVEVMNLPAGRNSTPNPKYRYEEETGFTPVGSTGDDNLGQRCEGNSSCVPICPVQAKYSALKTLDKALARDKVTLVAQAVASKILIDPDTGRITGIEFKRYPTPTPECEYDLCIARAKKGGVYVLAAHAVENAKLLLASGAAKTSDQVGRNLMDHPYFLTWGLMPESVGAFRGPGTTSGIPSFRDGPFRGKRAAFRTDIANWGWNMADEAPGKQVGQLVDGGRLFGARLREQIAGTIPRQVRLGFLMEQLPIPENRVTIDRRYLDMLEEPRPVIEYRLDEYTLKGIGEAKRISDAIFRQLAVERHSEYSDKRPGGYVEYPEGTGYNYMGSGHLVGTHRMGRSADDSVVNTDMRAWDHRNLYVVGCGSMPTIGTSNPTLTMTALTYRAIESILKDLGD
jgi:choline dehydrogenase-like flavoprotein